MDKRWLLPGEAARRLGVTRSGVLWFADTGRLRAVRTPSGVRLLLARDVERFRKARARLGQVGMSAGRGVRVQQRVTGG